jgi:hypothetical protein
LKSHSATAAETLVFFNALTDRVDAHLRARLLAQIRKSHPDAVEFQHIYAEPVSAEANAYVESVAVADAHMNAMYPYSRRGADPDTAAADGVADGLDVHDSMWCARPWGDSQLRPYLAQYYLDYAKERPYYPARRDVLSLLYHDADASPYVGVDVDVDALEKLIYVSNAQKAAQSLTQRVLTHLGGPPRFTIEVGVYTGLG